MATQNPAPRAGPGAAVAGDGGCPPAGLRRRGAAMNRFAFRTTGLGINTLSRLLRAKVHIHGQANIPRGGVIFVINHFTRIETFLLPYHIFQLTGTPVWSLASDELFTGSLGGFLEALGAVSIRNPDRDRLVVKTLLTGEATWIVFPEGRMVKNKKIVEKGRFMISCAGGKHPPHTGAAALAFRTEFYRQRIRSLMQRAPEELRHLLALFGISDPAPVAAQNTFIVPVNLTYYPIRAKENLLSQLAARLLEPLPERLLEELMTEGTMLLSGVDVDVRFGSPIDLREYMRSRAIRRVIEDRRRIYFDDLLPARRRMRRQTLRIMARYMGAIYGMTTVNHDHIFASLVRLSPIRRICEAALRRRAFLAVAVDFDKLGLQAHRSLGEDQTHLLTDDRYHKFAEFRALALEKKVLSQEAGHLVKDRRRFSPPLDFHRIRIDNPVAVIANEVEPLQGLLRRLRKLSWTPDFLVRRRVARFLENRALAQYLRDYEAFFAPGESKPKTTGMPLLLRGRTRRKGVLLIHGYLAAPPEVAALAQHLNRMGLWVYVARLRGHGTSPEDLATRSYRDWQASVDAGYALMASLCRRVVAGGISTGGGLALELTARVGGVSGVFAVCPPLKLQDLSARLVPAVDTWNRLMKFVHLEGGRKEFVANTPENPQINYLRNPISGVRELERFMASLEPRLPEITAPVLVVQADGDPVVTPAGSQRVFRLLGSATKAYLLLNFNRHGILLGPGAERVHRAIGSFVAEL